MNEPDAEPGALTTEVSTHRSDAWLKAVLIGRNPRFTLVLVIVLVVTCFILFKFVFIPIEVVGISMEPNYVEGQIRLVNKRAYRKADPQRGDVVAVKMKTEPVVLLKRIIGLPGERVVFVPVAPPGGGRPVIKVFVNGRPLDENYLKRPTHPSWSRAEFPVATNQYLVIGDNRSMRFRDHYQYLAEKSEILGKVTY